jgi:hypothetical protein
MVHATQALALLQTMFIPQGSPADLLVPSTQAETPVAHDVIPFLHLLGLVMQGKFGVHGLHVPPLQ